MGWVSFLLNCVLPGAGLLWSLGEYLMSAASVAEKTDNMVKVLIKFDKDGNGMLSSSEIASALQEARSEKAPEAVLIRAVLTFVYAAVSKVERGDTGLAQKLYNNIHATTRMGFTNEKMDNLIKRLYWITAVYAFFSAYASEKLINALKEGVDEAKGMITDEIMESHIKPVVEEIFAELFGEGAGLAVSTALGFL